jgi:hypothetical protein
MDRTLIAVQNMLGALDAPAYDIGILSDRGMLPGLSNLPAHLVVSRLPLLKAHNRRGAHIYIRPSGAHRFTVLDDLNQTSVERLTADDFEPCAVVETSAGNFQAWLKHDYVYPKDLSTFIAQTLAGRYQGDPGAADWRRFGRLPLASFVGKVPYRAKIPRSACRRGYRLLCGSLFARNAG